MSNKGKILIGLCLWDLFLTTIGIQTGIIIEKNPLLNYYLEQGLIYFVLIKIFINGICLIPIELYLKSENPMEKGLKLINSFYNTAIVLYILFLGIAFTMT